MFNGLLLSLLDEEPVDGAAAQRRSQEADKEGTTKTKL
jgi:hypothetical protein